ncbi:MAG: folate-binding protein YgfZ, partial [Oleiphilaceae bacterium]
DESNHYGEFLKTINLDKEIISNCINENDSYWLNISCQKNLCEAWIKKGTTKPFSLDHSKIISHQDWQALVTNCGIPEIYNSSQEEFILQFINLQQLGAVSFKKGCYTGQEIIARMKFLGKQKKMAYLLHSEQKCIQEPLAPTYNKDGAKCGTLIRSHWSEKTGSVALCILPMESALSLGGVFLNDSSSFPFSVTEIDYSEYKK